MNFDFIADTKFRALLIRDYEELERCLEIKSTKSVLILSGSIIESVLVEFFSTYPPEGVNPKKILNENVDTLLSLALEHGLITQPTKDLSTVVKNYRNLIHPGREIRKNEKFDFDTALVARSLLNIIIKEIKENYLKQIGYSADDIISKLENDSVSPAIFEKLILKLHKNERNKLYAQLVEYEFNRRTTIDNNHLSDPKKYIEVIKTHIERETVEKQFDKLIYKVEAGKKWEVMAFYHFLYEDMNYLSAQNKELILLYVLNALKEATNNPDEIEKYVDQKLFSSFGTLLINEGVKREFLEMVCTIVRFHTNRDYTYFSAYEQIMNSLDNERKEKVKNFIIKNVPTNSSEKFFKGYNDGDYFPF